MPTRANRQITTVTAPSVDLLCKTVLVLNTDITAFDAFALPKGAVVAGAYVIGQANSDAVTSCQLSVGTNPPSTNEIIAIYDLKTNGDGYFPVGQTAGSDVGNQLTSDKKYKAIANTNGAHTVGGPWLVKVEYYIPQQGESY